jgi:hypothetical protein
MEVKRKNTKSRMEALKNVLVLLMLEETISGNFVIMPVVLCHRS